MLSVVQIRRIRESTVNDMIEIARCASVRECPLALSCR